MGLEAYGYSINIWEHPVCKEWTEEGKPVKTESFSPGDKAYLRIEITWDNIEEYEEKWGKIPQWQHGIVTILRQGQPNQVAPRPRNNRATAGKITETAELKAIRIYLEDPDGKEVDIIQPRTIHDVQFEPPGCISTGHLELLEITDETANGYWKVVWEDNGKEIFFETFLVGEEPEDEEEEEDEDEGQPFSTKINPITLVAVPIIVILILIAIAVYIKRR